MAASNLSPIVLRSVAWQEVNLSCKIILIITLKLEDGLILAEKPEISLFAFAYSRNELINEVHAQIAMLWQEFVEVDSDTLSDDALGLRQRLLEWFVEQPISLQGSKS